MKYLLISACLIFFSTVSLAEDTNLDQPENILAAEDDPYFNIVFGVSPFSGLLGFEYQNGHNAFGFSPMKRIAYRYYDKPYTDTKFWGVYLGSYNRKRIDTDDYYTLHGVDYDDVKSSFIGAGAGYRWQWASGWNASVSIALEYAHNEYSNPGTSQSDDEYEAFLFPGLNAGYKF